MRNEFWRKLFGALEMERVSAVWSRTIAIFMTVLIGSNVIAVVLESVGPIQARHRAFFEGFEVFSVVVFTVEYILRLLLCTEHPDFPGQVIGRIRYILTPMALVDLLAILPFYAPLLIGLDLRFLRALRLLRIIRVLKLGRYSSALRVMKSVLSAKRGELIVCVFVVSILLVLVSGLMFLVENEAQPDAFSSIPATMWWAVATMTTVGYGDIYPITALGKILAGCMALLGVGLFALPAGILAGGFAEAIRAKAKTNCPHCGKTLT